MSSYDNKSDNDESQFQTNLIINYLPQSLTDNEFLKIFERVGPVAQSKIIRNKNNSYSYGFGFITYYNSADSQKAISQLNGLQLKNKRIKVALSRQPCDEIKNSKIYIKNLPQTINVESLNQIFGKYGKIIQSNIIENKGIAFILFDKREQSEKAIENLQNMTLPGSTEPLQIKFASGVKFNNNNNFQNQNLRPMRQFNNNNFNSGNYNNNNFSGNNFNSNNNNRQNNNMNYNRTSRNYQQSNISPNFDDADNNYSSNNYSSNNSNSSRYNSNRNNLYNGPIRNNFQHTHKSHHTNRYNPMNNSFSLSGTQQENDYDTQSYKSNEYSYSSGQNRNYQYQQNNNYQQNNYSSANKNYHQTNDQMDHTIFVYNIGLNTEEELHDLFSTYGQVIKLNVIRKNRGFAFILYDKRDQAEQAIQNLNNYSFNGQKLQVSFKK